MDTRAAARELNVRESTISILVRKGAFPGASKVAKGNMQIWNIPAEDVAAYKVKLGNRGGGADGKLSFVIKTTQEEADRLASEGHAIRRQFKSRTKLVE